MTKAETRSTTPDRAAFIRTQTALLPVPLIPEIRLHLASEATALWHLTEAELSQGGLPPPFWAFAWAGGVGLARYILDHPETVVGRRVVDFASGSGLVAIAARQAGAAEVVAVDIDPFAEAAIALNAEANGVSVAVRRADLIGQSLDADVLLAGDVFYDRGLAARLVPWFGALAAGGMSVLAGDPARAYRPADGWARLAEIDVPADSRVEEGAVKRTAILRIAAAP